MSPSTDYANESDRAAWRIAPCCRVLWQLPAGSAAVETGPRKSDLAFSVFVALVPLCRGIHMLLRGSKLRATAKFLSRTRRAKTLSSFLTNALADLAVLSLLGPS